MVLLGFPSLGKERQETLELEPAGALQENDVPRSGEPRQVPPHRLGLDSPA